MSLNQSLISDFSEYYRWSQRTKIKYKLHYGWCTGRRFTAATRHNIILFHFDSFSVSFTLQTQPNLHSGGSDLRLNDGLLIKLSKVGWGLMLCLWLGLLEVSLILVGSVCMISHEYSSLFIMVRIWFFMFSLWCIDWVRESLCKPNFLCIFFLY